jgi:hypothetical protein
MCLSRNGRSSDTVARMAVAVVKQNLPRDIRLAIAWRTAAARAAVSLRAGAETALSAREATS